MFRQTHHGMLHSSGASVVRPEVLILHIKLGVIPFTHGLDWLVVWIMNCIFPLILGIIILTDYNWQTNIFQRGGSTTNQYTFIPPKKKSWWFFTGSHQASAKWWCCWFPAFSWCFYRGQNGEFSGNWGKIWGEVMVYRLPVKMVTWNDLRTVQRTFRNRNSMTCLDVARIIDKNGSTWPHFSGISPITWSWTRVTRGHPDGTPEDYGEKWGRGGDRRIPNIGSRYP